MNLHFTLRGLSPCVKFSTWGKRPTSANPVFSANATLDWPKKEWPKRAWHTVGGTLKVSGTRFTRQRAENTRGSAFSFCVQFGDSRCFGGGAGATWRGRVDEVYAVELNSRCVQPVGGTSVAGCWNSVAHRDSVVEQATLLQTWKIWGEQVWSCEGIKVLGTPVGKRPRPMQSWPIQCWDLLCVLVRPRKVEGEGPKFRVFFFFFLSPVVFSLNFGGVLKAGTLKCARLGSRVVV